MMWDDALIFGLVECPPDALRWAAAGYRAGVRDGRDQVLAAVDDAGKNLGSDVTRTLALPSWDTLVEARRPDYRPCPRKCRACSACIASEAYWARGGRPYLGVEQEAALVAREAA